MTFILMCFVWFGMLAIAAIVALVLLGIWQRERSMADRTWQDKVRHQVRRVLLF